MSRFLLLTPCRPATQRNARPAQLVSLSSSRPIGIRRGRSRELLPRQDLGQPECPPEPNIDPPRNQGFTRLIVGGGRHRRRAAIFDAGLRHFPELQPRRRRGGGSAAHPPRPDAGLKAFLDRYALPAGKPWQPELEAALACCRALVVLLGPAGIGDWQHREIQLGLDRQAAAEKTATPFPVIPVLLPGLQPDDVPLGTLPGPQHLGRPAPGPRRARAPAAPDRRRARARRSTASRRDLAGLAPLSRPAAVPRAGCRPVLRPRALRRRARRQGPPAHGHQPRRRRRPLRQRQVVGRLRRPVPGAAPGEGHRPAGGLGHPRACAPGRAAARADRGLRPARRTSRPDRRPGPRSTPMRTCFRKGEVTAGPARPRPPAGRTPAPPASCSTSTSGRSSTRRPSRARSRPRRTSAAPPTRGCSSISSSTLPPRRPAPWSSASAPTSTPTSRTTTRLRAAVQDCQVSLGPMTEAELRAAIEGPAKAVGGSVDPDLTKKLIRDIGLDRERRPRRPVRHRQAAAARIRARAGLDQARHGRRSALASMPGSSRRSRSAPTSSTSGCRRSSRPPPSACS